MHTWINFADWAIAQEAGLQHTTIAIRIDADPALPDDWMSTLEQHFAKRSPPVKIQRGAGGHHEAVGLAEQFNGFCERQAEGALARRGKGVAWIIPARLYAGNINNLTLQVQERRAANPRGSSYR